MGKIWRLLLLALLLNASLATMALARAVYLADGGIIQAQKVWKEEGRIYLLLNRDSLITFTPEEINLKKTFAKKTRTTVTKSVAKSVTTPAPVVAPTVPVAAVKTVTPAAPPAQATPATAVSTSPVKVTPPPAKVSTPPVAAPAKTAAKPVAKKPAPRPRPAAAAPAPTSGSSSMVFAALGGVLLFLLVLIASIWKVFVKAGQAGWKSLVPFYNFFVLLQIAGCPSWWFLMFFIPLVNLYFMVVMYIRLAEKFGKSVLFGFALCFLGFIFFPILAFGSATYGEEETFTFEEE